LLYIWRPSIYWIWIWMIISNGYHSAEVDVNYAQWHRHIRYLASLANFVIFCCKSLYVLRSLLCLGRNSWAVSSETKVWSERWINYCSAVINEPQARRARDNPINICYYALSRDTPYSVSSKLSPPINPANSTKGVEFYSTHSDKWSYDIVHRTSNRPISI